MATSYPTTIPFPWSGDDLLSDAYARGWNHGHGLACHNVPSIGQKIWTESDGKITIDADNVRDVHASLCHESADHSRCHSPFEFTAHEFNESEYAEDLWEAFEAGTSAAIAADLAEYTDEDYGIEPKTEGEEEEQDTITAPECWACALIYNDRSGLSDEECAALDKRLDDLHARGLRVVDVLRDKDGDAKDPYFTWSYALYGGTAQGGNVLDYVVLPTS